MTEENLDGEIIQLENNNLVNELPEDIKAILDNQSTKTSEESNFDKHVSEKIEQIEQLENVESQKIEPDRNLNIYTNEINLPYRTIRVRKWKIKDKKNLNHARTLPEIKQALVYNCIEDGKDVVLDTEEFNFVLMKIRALTIQDNVTCEYVCPECGTTSTQSFNLSEVISTVGGDYSTLIAVGGNVFEMKVVDNAALYTKLTDLNEDPFSLFANDFALHVKSYNGIEIKTSKDHAEFLTWFDNLDADLGNEIFDQWLKMKFRIDYKKPIECSECGHIELANFVEMPDFFPKSWRIEQ